jgi:hypothetical protein
MYQALTSSNDEAEYPVQNTQSHAVERSQYRTRCEILAAAHSVVHQ